MNQEWQKEIRRKVLQYREIPTGIDRAALERRMLEACAAGRRRVVAVWSRRLVAAAAVAALAVPLADMLRNAGGEAVESRPRAVAVSGSAAPSDGAAAPRAVQVPAAVAVAEAVPSPAVPVTAGRQGAEAAADRDTASAAPAYAGPSYVPAQTAGGQSAAPVEPQKGQSADRYARPRTTPSAAVAAMRAYRHGRRGRIKASACLANAVQGSSDRHAMPAVLPMADPIGEFGTPFSGRESEPMLAQAEPASTEVDHRPPVRVGLTVSLPLGRRWAVESGLMYSYLYSEITSGSSNCSAETAQRLHYVGIPVGVSYTMWSNRRFAVYARAGGMVEKMVSGRADTHTIVDGREESAEREHLSIGPLQFSLNGGVGAEWRFADRVGAYVEPGVSYSFDNGSSVRTFYADRPFAFNLAFGLRFGVVDRD